MEGLDSLFPRNWESILNDCPECGGIYTVVPDGFMEHPEFGIEVPKARCCCGRVFMVAITLHLVREGDSKEK